MKKVIAVLMVLMFATSAFAVGTATKQLSQAGLPETLTTDSILIAGTFPQKIGAFGQLAALEAFATTPLTVFAYSVFDSAVGTLGISVNPAMGASTGVTAELPANQLGINWANDTLGIGLQIGMENSGFEYKTANAGYNNDPDKNSDTRMLIGLTAGMTLDVGMPLDLGLGVMLANQSTEDKNNIDASTKDYDNLYSTGEIGVKLAARTELAELLWVLGADIALGSEKTENQEDGNADGDWNDAGEHTIDTWDKNLINANLLVGKIIKASETLKVTVGSGVYLQMSSTAQTSAEDKNVANSKTYGPFPGGTVSFTGIAVPLWVAVEGKLNETWRINAGVKSLPVKAALEGTNYRDAATDKTASKNYYNTGIFNVASALEYGIGLTGVIGDLQMDLCVNPGILLAGPNLISNATLNPMNISAALVYGWK